MSRPSNTHARRAQIVDALLTSMATYGYQKSTIQVIAKTASLAPGLIHYHFKTKKEILLALVTTLSDLSMERYLRLADKVESPRDKLRAYIDARLAKGDGDNPAAVAAWVVIGAEAVREPEVRSIYQASIEKEMVLISSLLTECLKQQGKNILNVNHLAAGLMAFMEGAFQLASAAPDAMPAGYAADIARKMVCGFLDDKNTPL